MTVHGYYPEPFFVYPTLEREENQAAQNIHLPASSDEGRSWSCLTWSGWVAGGLFGLSSLILVKCTVNDCYDFVRQDISAYCDSECSPYWVAIAAISGVASSVFLCLSKWR